MSLHLFESSRFGRFEPSHLGLYISLNSLIDPHDATRAVEHINLLGATTRRNVGREHKEFLATSPLKDRGRVAATFSLFAHETRHFHDVILTSYGSFLMRQALQLSLGYFASVRQEVAFLCDAVYVPISDWVGNYDIVSKAHPTLSQPTKGIAAYIDFYSEIYRRLAVFERSTLSQLPLTATSIMEASAVLTQEEHIRSNFGADTVVNFRELFQAGASTTYFGALDLMIAWFEAELPLDIQAIIIFSALCGDYRSEATFDYSTPVNAFALVIDEVKKRCEDPRSPSQVIKTIQGLFNRLGWGSLASSIRKAHGENKNLLAVAKEHYRGMTEDNGVRACIAAFDNYIRLQDEMIAWFLNDPGEYFDFRRYCHGLYSLPMPLVFLETEKALPFHPTQLSDFNIEIGTKIRLGDVPVDHRKELAGLSDNEDTITLWHLLSSRPEAADGSPFCRIDAESWRELNAWTTSSNFLFELDRGLIPDYLAQTQIEALAAVGTKVFTAGGPHTPRSRIWPGIVSSDLQRTLDRVAGFKVGQFAREDMKECRISLGSDGTIQVDFGMDLGKRTEGLHS